MSNLSTSKCAKPQPGRTGAEAQVRRVEVGALFGDAREVIILHRGEDYRLRITSNDKLILTK